MPSGPIDACRIALITMGGTIAMLPSSDGGLVPAVSPGELLEAVPGLSRLGIAIEATELRNIPSASLSSNDLRELSEAIKKRLSDGFAGVVVAQGTDTLEETSYALDLRHAGEQPVVMTGAMRSPAAAGADGPANLLAAIATAADPAAWGRGVLVCMADELHAASRVRKTHSTSPAAFGSPGRGPVGHVVEGVPRFAGPPAQRMTISLPAIGSGPRVCLLTMTLGDDGHLLGAVDGSVDGLVIAGFGAGHVPAALAEPLGEIAQRIPVLLTTRAGAGPVTTRTYGYPGSEQDLLSRGLISAGLLDPLKARILLRSLLAVTADRGTIAAAVAAAGGCTDAPAWPWPQGDENMSQ
ncbi:MAG TPA: asparaginase [Mycobacteriales bacterium]|nr:asparaginase [Mycobacteriales bacterium]